MLSKNYQMFLMLLLNHSITRQELKMFGTAKSFYKMVGYLRKNGLIESETLEGNRKRYSLTMQGEILANSLILLDDNRKINFSLMITSPYEKLWL